MYSVVVKNKGINILTTSANEVVNLTNLHLYISDSQLKLHNQFKHAEHALSTVFNR